jgi:phosphatidate cytidylyltransferase
VGTRTISSDPRRAAPRGAPGRSFERPANAGRDVPLAIGVGVGFAVLALLLFNAGPKYTMALVVGIVVLASVELFDVLRRSGYHPASLLGIAATASLALGAYYKGEAAYPIVLFLTAAFGLVWYLAGAGGEESPVLGLGSTLLGVGYIGVLGSFAALLLRAPDGIGLLLGAVLAAVGYDVFGFFVGRNAGTRQLSAISPNKTVEGLIGGFIGCALVGVAVIAGLIHPWDDLSITEKLAFGLAAAVAAALGDLSESLLKRDLGVKDMGTVLPGHGGMLDRFDAMLFVLPTTYCAALILFS